MLANLDSSGKDLRFLLETLEGLQLGGGGIVGQDAVVAMNHLKRLEGQGTRIGDKERMVRLMRELRYV